LVAKGQPWSMALASDQVLRIAVNHQIVDASQVVAAGDEVAFFPPVTGG
jgi:molybdopterin synthase sulfur carrier subunit